jgi:hypothetical protein
MGKDLLPPLEGPKSAYKVAFSHSWSRFDFLRENWSSACNNNNIKETQAKPLRRLQH